MRHPAFCGLILGLDEAIEVVRLLQLCKGLVMLLEPRPHNPCDRGHEAPEYRTATIAEIQRQASTEKHRERSTERDKERAWAFTALVQGCHGNSDACTCARQVSKGGQRLHMTSAYDHQHKQHDVIATHVQTA